MWWVGIAVGIVIVLAGASWTGIQLSVQDVEIADLEDTIEEQNNIIMAQTEQINELKAQLAVKEEMSKTPSLNSLINKKKK